MTSVAVHSAGVASGAAVRQARRDARWWRWLAASAVFVPGGGMAYHLLSEPEPPPDDRPPALPDAELPSVLASV
jgi:hypothetical protein